jgi:hypothetical protein
MTIRVYVRDRLKVGSGVKEPKYRVVAVTAGSGEEAKMKIEATHFRKLELEQIAKDVNAEVVYLHPMPENKRGSMKK